MQDFHFADTNMLVSEKPRRPNPNLHRPNAKPHTPNDPNGSNRWNIGCVVSPHIVVHIGHVHFMFFVSISFALGSQGKCNFWWNMGFKPIFHCDAKTFALGRCIGLDPKREFLRWLYQHVGIHKCYNLR